MLTVILHVLCRDLKLFLIICVTWFLFNLFFLSIQYCRNYPLFPFNNQYLHFTLFYFLYQISAYMNVSPWLYLAIRCSHIIKETFFFNDFKYYWCPVIISKPKHFRWPFGCFTLVLIWPLVVIIQIWQWIPVWRTPHLCYIWPLDVLAGVVWPGLRFDPAAWWPLPLIRPLAVGTTGSGL